MRSKPGFASAGVDVLLSGPLPTPGVAYLTRALRLDLGVVISASHNPFGDNGVKFFSARGEKAARRLGNRSVEAALDQEPPQWVDSARAWASAKRLEDAQWPLHRVLQEHGAAHDVASRHEAGRLMPLTARRYHVAPDVFHELGASGGHDRLLARTA